MKRKSNSFLHRVKFKRLKKYEQFGITFAITYLITIAFVLFIVFHNFEGLMMSTGNIKSIWSFIRTSQVKFTFGYCSHLNATTYLIAKLFESMITTTITFSGTILILQTTKVKSSLLNAALFILLSFYIMVGIFFLLSRLETTLKFYMWVLLILFLFVFVLSAKLFRLQSKDENLHKQEESDGKMTS